MYPETLAGAYRIAGRAGRGILPVEVKQAASPDESLHVTVVPVRDDNDLQAGYDLQEQIRIMPPASG